MGVIFKVIWYELAVLLSQFVLANSYLLLPASPGCCGDEPLYQRVAFLSCILLLTTLAADVAILLSARTYKGVGWKLRALLLLDIALSAASSFIVLPTFETGYAYRKGCVYSRDSVAVALMVIMALEHGGAAFLVAVALD
ncbi:unnamed protein product [Alopecurus aequalis]